MLHIREGMSMPQVRGNIHRCFSLHTRCTFPDLAPLPCISPATAKPPSSQVGAPAFRMGGPEVLVNAYKRLGTAALAECTMEGGKRGRKGRRTSLKEECAVLSLAQEQDSPRVAKGAALMSTSHDSSEDDTIPLTGARTGCAGGAMPAERGAQKGNVSTAAASGVTGHARAHVAAASPPGQGSATGEAHMRGGFTSMPGHPGEAELQMLAKHADIRIVESDCGKGFVYKRELLPELIKGQASSLSAYKSALFY
jgi:hypothetical protein